MPQSKSTGPILCIEMVNWLSNVHFLRSNRVASKDNEVVRSGRFSKYFPAGAFASPRLVHLWDHFHWIYRAPLLGKKPTSGPHFFSLDLDLVVIIGYLLKWIFWVLNFAHQIQTILRRDPIFGECQCVVMISNLCVQHFDWPVTSFTLPIFASQKCSPFFVWRLNWNFLLPDQLTLSATLCLVE